MKREIIILAIGSIFLFMGFNLYSQKKSKDNCKYIQNTTDEFSKKRVVTTEGKIVFDEKVIKGWGVSDILSNSYRLIFNVYGCNFNGINALKFDYAAYNAPSGFIDSFYQIDLLLEDGDVISFNQDGSSEYLIKPDWEHNWKIYTVKDDAKWTKLNTIPLKKVRVYQTNKMQRTMEIKEKNKKIIMEIINCIDILEIPKPELLSNNNETKNNQLGNSNVRYPLYFPIDSSTQKIDYKGLITVENRNKSQLFQGAKEWFAKIFSSYSYNNGLTSGSFNAGITYQDTTTGKIIGTGIIDVRIKNTDGSEISGGIVSYGVTIMVKDKRYKYEITGFSHKGYRSTGIHDLGLIEDWILNDNQGMIQSYWNQVNDKILQLISSLNVSMNQDSNDGKW